MSMADQSEEADPPSRPRIVITDELAKFIHEEALEAAADQIAASYFRAK